MRRLFITLFLLLFVTHSFAALPATDAFSGTNAPLSGSANWSLCGCTAEDGIDEGSGYITPSEVGASDNAYYWNADTFADDQYGQKVMTQDNDSANHRIGIMLRAGAGTGGFLVRYLTATADSDFRAYYYTAQDTRTRLADSVMTADNATIDTANDAFDPSESFLAGDIMRIEVVGKTLTLKIDFGSGFVTQGSWDATGVGPDSGSVGLYMAGAVGATAVRGDDWEGGDLAAAGVAVQRRRHMQ